MKKILVFLLLITGLVKSQVVVPKSTTTFSNIVATGNLRVNGSSTLTGNVTTSSITSTGNLDLGCATGSVVSLKSGSSNILQASSSSLFLPNKTRIGSFSTPSATLDVTGTMSVSGTASVNSTFNIFPSVTSGGVTGLNIDASINAGTGTLMSIKNSGGNTAFVIANSDLKAQFYGGSAVNVPVISFVGGTTSGLGYGSNRVGLIANGNAGLVMNTDGKVHLGAGSTSLAPTAQLEVTGTMSVSGTSTLTGAVQTSTINNNSGTLYLGAFGSNVLNVSGGTIGFAPSGNSTTGSSVPFSFSSPSHFSITASTNVPSLKVTGTTRGFMSGAKALQYENWLTASTYTATGATTITTASGLHVEKPIMSTNVTATNIYGISTDGNLLLGSAGLTGGNSGTIAVLSDAVFTESFRPSVNTVPADATTYYFPVGDWLNWGTTAGAFDSYMYKNVTIIGMTVNWYINGAGASAETFTVGMRINGSNVPLTTAMTCSSSGANTFTFSVNQNIDAGVKYEPYITTPTWVTNPATSYPVITFYYVRRQ